MSARSSVRSVLLLTVLAACGKSAAKTPEVDPARIKTLAARMLKNLPVPAAVRDCKDEEMLGNATLTVATLTRLAEQPLEKRPELEDYVNPSELDTPAARTLIESQDPSLRRQAAAELMLAQSFLVYNIDLVDTPLPMGVKDFKRGHVGARALRYDKNGNIQCQNVFLWTNHPDKQAWAIKMTDKPLVDPSVKLEMQKDLRAQMLVRVAGLGAPAPKTTGPADDRHDRN